MPRVTCTGLNGFVSRCCFRQVTIATSQPSLQFQDDCIVIFPNNCFLRQAMREKNKFIFDPQSYYSLLSKES